MARLPFGLGVPSPPSRYTAVIRPRLQLVANVIATIFIGLALFTLFVPTFRRTHEGAGVMKCQTNLRQIFVAILQYTAAHHEWPRTRYDPDAQPPTAFTAPDAPDPFANDGPAPNDVSAAYFLLVRAGAPLEIFIDPLSDRGPLNPGKTDWSRRSNFRDDTELSYSFANPYPSRAAAQAGYRLDDKLTAEFPIAADMNPGVPGLLEVDRRTPAAPLERVASPNHRPPYPKGSNVLYGDGHAEFQTSPMVGVAGDNIYTYGGHQSPAGGIGIIGSPVDAEDSVLLPIAPRAAVSQREQSSLGRLALAACAIAGCVVIALMVWIFKWRGRQRPRLTFQEAGTTESRRP